MAKCEVEAMRACTCAWSGFHVHIASCHDISADYATECQLIILSLALRITNCSDLLSCRLYAMSRGWRRQAQGATESPDEGAQLSALRK